jgi:hypothetical protein
MLLLMAAVSTVAASPAVPAARARATVRVERPAVANAEQWKRAAPELRRYERLIEDERGRFRLLRLIEYE